MRQLPQLTPVTEWFWTSGTDGCLRIQGRQDCDRFEHRAVLSGVGRSAIGRR